MFTELQQQFIEVAARELIDAEAVRVHPTSATVTWLAGENAGAYLLGVVETINGPLSEIVKAAEASVVCSNCGHGEFHRTVHPKGCPICKCGDPFFPPFDPAAIFGAIARERLGLGKVSEEFGEIVLTAPHDRECPNLKTIKETLVVASGRWDEWGTRALACAELLEAAVYGPHAPRPFTVPRLTTGGDV